MTRPTGPARHAGGMNIYLINALLVLLVVRQIREHQLDLRALAVPVLAVGAAAVMFLYSCRAAAATSRWTCSACRPARPWARSAAWLRTCGPALTACRWAAPGSWRRACGSPSAPGWSSTSPRPTGRGRDCPVQRRAPHHRPRRLDRRAGHDGAGRRARPAGRRLPPRPPATPGTPVLAAPAQACAAAELASAGAAPPSPIRRRPPRRLVHVTSRPGPSRPHRGRSDGPASVQAAHVRFRAREYQQLAAEGNASAKPAMPRHRGAARWPV